MLKKNSDAELIAQALNNIADAIREFSHVMAGEDQEPLPPTTYMDGTPIE